MAAMKKKSDLAEPDLRQALRSRPTLEVRQRVERLLARIEGGGLSDEWVRH